MKQLRNIDVKNDPMDDLGTRGTNLGRPDGSANVDRYLYGCSVSFPDTSKQSPQL